MSGIPVSFEFFKSCIYYEELVEQILKAMSHGDSKHFQEMFSSEDVKQSALENFYRKFYSEPQARQKYIIRFRPMPKKVKDKLLQYAGAKDQTGCQIYDKKQDKTNQTEMESRDINAKENNENSALDLCPSTSKTSQITGMKTPERVTADSSSSRRNTDYEERRNIVKLPPVSSTAQIHYMDMKKFTHHCPVTFSQFKKYTNVKEVVRRRQTKKHGTTTGNASYWEMKTYLIYYLYPQFRNTDSYLKKITITKNCPDALKAKIHEIPVIEETNEDSNNNSSSAKGVEVGISLIKPVETIPDVKSKQKNMTTISKIPLKEIDLIDLTKSSQDVESKENKSNGNTCELNADKPHPTLFSSTIQNEYVNTNTQCTGKKTPERFTPSCSSRNTDYEESGNIAGCQIYDKNQDKTNQNEMESRDINAKENNENTALDLRPSTSKISQITGMKTPERVTAGSSSSRRNTDYEERRNIVKLPPVKSAAHLHYTDMKKYTDHCPVTFSQFKKYTNLKEVLNRGYTKIHGTPTGNVSYWAMKTYLIYYLYPQFRTTDSVLKKITVTKNCPDALKAKIHEIPVIEETNEDSNNNSSSAKGVEVGISLIKPVEAIPDVKSKQKNMTTISKIPLKEIDLMDLTKSSQDVESKENKSNGNTCELNADKPHPTLFSSTIQNEYVNTNTQFTGKKTPERFTPSCSSRHTDYEESGNIAGCQIYDKKQEKTNQNEMESRDMNAKGNNENTALDLRPSTSKISQITGMKTPERVTAGSSNSRRNTDYEERRNIVKLPPVKSAAHVHYTDMKKYTDHCPVTFSQFKKYTNLKEVLRRGYTKIHGTPTGNASYWEKKTYLIYYLYPQFRKTDSVLKKITVTKNCPDALKAKIHEIPVIEETNEDSNNNSSSSKGVGVGISLIKPVETIPDVTSKQKNMTTISKIPLNEESKEHKSNGNTCELDEYEPNPTLCSSTIQKRKIEISEVRILDNLPNDFMIPLHMQTKRSRPSSEHSATKAQDGSNIVNTNVLNINDSNDLCYQLMDLLLDALKEPFDFSTFPISLQEFKLCSFYKEPVKQIICDYCGQEKELIEIFMKNNELFDTLVMYYYRKYFTNPNLHKKYPLKLKMCPASLRNKILSFIKTTEGESIQVTQRGFTDNRQQKRNDAIVLQKRCNRSENLPGAPTDSNLNDKAIDADLNYQESAQCLCHGLICRTHTLSYMLRTSFGMKRRITQILVSLTIQEFKSITHIYHGPHIYEDHTFLNIIYEYVRTGCVWPKNLYIKLDDLLCKLVQCGELICDTMAEPSAILQHISPKFLYWSNLLSTTNFMSCVASDYLHRTGEHIDMANKNIVEAECKNYYNRCWNQEEWIGKIPKVNENVLTILRGYGTAAGNITKTSDVPILIKEVTVNIHGDIGIDVHHHTTLEHTGQNIAADDVVGESNGSDTICNLLNKTLGNTGENIATNDAVVDESNGSDTICNLLDKTIGNAGEKIATNDAVVDESSGSDAIFNLLNKTLERTEENFASNDAVVDESNGSDTICNLLDKTLGNTGENIATNDAVVDESNGSDAICNLLDKTLGNSGENIATNDAVVDESNGSDAICNLLDKTLGNTGENIATNDAVVDESNGSDAICNLLDKTLGNTGENIASNDAVVDASNGSDTICNLLDKTLGKSGENIAANDVIDESNGSDAICNLLDKTLGNTGENIAANDAVVDESNDSDVICLSVSSDTTTMSVQTSSQSPDNNNSLGNISITSTQSISSLNHCNYITLSSTQEQIDTLPPEIIVPDIIDPLEEKNDECSSNSDEVFECATMKQEVECQPPLRDLQAVEDSKGSIVWAVVEEKIVDLDKSDPCNQIDDMENLPSSQIDFGDSPRITRNLLSGDLISSGSSGCSMLNLGQRLPSYCHSDEATYTRQQQDTSVARNIDFHLQDITLSNSGNSVEKENVVLPTNVDNILESSPADEVGSNVEPIPTCVDAQSSTKTVADSLPTAPINTYSMDCIPTKLLNTDGTKKLKITGKHKGTVTTKGDIVPQRTHKIRPLPLKVLGPSSLATSTQQQTKSIPSVLQQITETTQHTDSGRIEISGNFEPAATSSQISSTSQPPHLTPTSVQNPETLRVSQELSKDCTVFNNSSLLRASKPVERPLDLNPLADNPETSSKSPLPPLQVNSTTAPGTCNYLSVDRPPTNRFILYHRLVGFHYFDNLASRHISDYQLATLNYGSRYFKATIICGNLKTILTNESLAPLGLSGETNPDFFVILKNLEEFHYSPFGRSAIERVEDLRERVLFWYIHTALPFSFATLTYDEQNSEYSKCKSVKHLGMSDIPRRMPYKCLTNALESKILNRLGKLKKEIINRKKSKCV